MATHTIGVVLCQCLPEPHREGEVALLDAGTRRPLCIGRSGAHFCQQRAGAMIDHGPLKGTCISAEQLELTFEGEGARVRNIGNAHVFVDGSPLPKESSVFVLPGAVIEVLGHCVLASRWPKGVAGIKGGAPRVRMSQIVP